MALLKRGRSKRVVLDVGTSAIRLCELSQTKAGFQLTKYYQREIVLDPSLEESEKIAQRKAVLQALLKEAKIRPKKTIMAVPGQSVFTRNRPLPPVPEYKVTQIVKYEIQQQIPFSLDQIALDYQVLDRTEVGGYDVMMAAIKVDVVEKQVEILAKTGRHIDVVDVSPLAAYNWLRHTGEFGEEGECVALLDLGATTTDIVIQKDNQFRFTRSLNVGGNDVTKAIAQSFNMTFAEAEKVKREQGFAPTGDPKRDGRGGEVIGGVLDRLVNEINRSFAYFRSQPGGGPTSRVIVTGGGACMRNMVPYLQNQLGIEVRIAQPLAGLAIAPGASEASEHPEQACVVLGLALRCCQSVPIQINLIPPRIIEVARRKEQVFYWVLSLLTFLLILASIIPITARKDSLVSERIELLQKTLASYDPALIANPGGRSDYEEQFMFARDDLTKYEKQVNALDSVRNNRNFWLEYIAAVNDARPASGGIAISSIESAVIGGPGNTGDAVRNAAKKQEEPPPVEEKAPEADATPSKGGLSGLASALGKQGGLSGFGLGRPGGARGPAKVSETYEAAGFPGIGGGGGRSMGGGGGGLGGLSGLGGGGRGGGGRGGRNQNKGADARNTVTEPNGLIIWGYAKNPDYLRLYESRLEARPEFKLGTEDDPKSGVYLWVTEANDVSYSELDNGRGSGGGGMSGGGSRRGGGGSRRGSGGGGGFGGLGGLSGMGGGMGSRGGMGRGGGGGRGSTRVASSQYGGEDMITRFRIDVQFLGKVIPKPTARAQGGGSGRGGGGLSGLRGLGSSR